MCGIETMSCLTLDMIDWLSLLGMRETIELDIDIIINKRQSLDKRYIVGRNCFIHINNSTQLVILQFWFRFVRTQFRPDINTIRLTFAQWRLLMDVHVD